MTTLLTMLIIACGGALGSVCRFATNMLAIKVLGADFPYGTLIVNSLGCFLAGFFMIVAMDRYAANDLWRLFFMIGFLGAYTTFSSFSWETWFLFEQGAVFIALMNIVLNNVCSLGFVFIGIYLGRFLSGL